MILFQYLLIKYNLIITYKLNISKFGIEIFSWYIDGHHPRTQTPVIWAANVIMHLTDGVGKGVGRILDKVNVGLLNVTWNYHGQDAHQSFNRSGHHTIVNSINKPGWAKMDMGNQNTSTYKLLLHSNDMSPLYMKSLFIKKCNEYELRDFIPLIQPKLNTIT